MTKSPSLSRATINSFEKLVGQLEGLHQELSAMAKKSPNDAVNAFKLRFINSTLMACNSLLGNTYRPYDDFAKFEEDDVPTNSDATMIIGQYLECAEKMRCDHIYLDYHWYWRDDDRSEIRTAPPKKLGKA